MQNKTTPSPESLFSKADIHNGDIKNHIEHIVREFEDGFEFLKRYPRSVSIFGGSMVKPDSLAWKNAEELGAKIATDLKYAVITGGGPGIMQAANKGAFEAGGISLGMNISLPHERNTNAFATHAIKFSYFFSRKTMLTFASEGYVFFPGGFGTMDELFSIMTLIQTGKIPHVPVIMFGSEYWNNVNSLIKKVMLDHFHTIDKKDLDLYMITDSVDEVIKIIKKAPVSDWWRNIN